MVEMAQHPVKLDNWMNEGIAFAIDRFEVSLPDCPIGRCPVMIGRRKPAYNTINKVMGRLNPVNHETHCYCGCTLRFFIKSVTCPISVLMFFLFMSVGIKRPRWDTPPCLLLGCLKWRCGPLTWVGRSVPRSYLHRVDSVAGWDSTNTIVYIQIKHIEGFA